LGEWDDRHMGTARFRLPASRFRLPLDLRTVHPVMCLPVILLRPLVHRVLTACHPGIRPPVAVRFLRRPCRHRYRTGITLGRRSAEKAAGAAGWF